VTSNDADLFIKDLLASLFLQLRKGQIHNNNEERDLRREYHEYLAAQSPQHDTNQVDVLRQALHGCVEAPGHVFVVVDGIDRCCDAADSLLQTELTSLQELGVHIMTTSRIQCCEELDDEVTCDGPDCGEITSPMYWTCQTCQSCDFCIFCISKGTQCINW
jgi:hypothetical protein